MFIAGLTSCASAFTARIGIQRPLAARSRIGVLVMNGDGAAASSPLEAYVSATLIDAGFTVKSFRARHYAPQVHDEILYPFGAYGMGRAIADGIKSGGELEGESDVVNTLLSQHDIGDASIRLDAILAQTAKVQKAIGVDYVLVIYDFGSYALGAYLVEMSSKDVLMAYAVTANGDGWQAHFGQPAATTTRAYQLQSGDAPGWRDLQFAERVVELIR